MPLTFDNPRIVYDVNTGTILEASAGSGKTTILTERWIASFFYLIIWEKRSVSEALSMIVALTFTRKAATEMKMRIRERINEIWEHNELLLLIQSLEQFATPCPMTVDDILNSSIKDQIDDLLSGATITTINAFVLQALRSNPLDLDVDLGLNPEDQGSDISITEMDSQTLLFQNLLQNFYRGSLEQQLFEISVSVCGVKMWQNLFKQIRELVAQYGESFIYQGIYNSGFNQYEHHLDKIVNSSNPHQDIWDILSPTVENLLSVLERENSHKKLTSDNLEFFTMLKKIDHRSLVQLFSKNLLGGYKEGNKVKDDDLNALRQDSLEAYRELIDGLYKVIIPFIIPISKLCSNIVRELQTEMKEISFGESELVLLEFLHKNNFLSKMQSRIKYFFADEYQDTSDVQKSIFDKIISSPHIVPFFVGDPKQSIYSFRKANVYVFQQTVDEFKQKNFHVAYLNTNYRSSCSHVEFVNFVFGDIFSKDQSGIQYHNQECQKTDLGEFHYTLALGVDEEESYSVQERVEYAYKDAFHVIQSYLEQGVNPGDIMILFRNKINILEFYQYTKELAPNLPISSSVKNILWDHPTILPLLNFLRVLIYPHDNLAVIALLKTPFFRKTDAEINDLLLIAKNHAQSLYDVLPIEHKRIIDDLLIIKDRISLEEMLTTIIKITHYEEILFSGGELATLHLFLEESRNIQQKRLMNLTEFMNFIDNKKPNITEAEFSGEEGKTLRMMTIHSSKGLESPYVIYIHKAHTREDKDRFPYFLHNKVAFDSLGKGLVASEIAKIASQETTSEEKRLAYVALTRAKKNFVFCSLPSLMRGSKGDVFATKWESFLNKELIESHVKFASCIWDTSTPISSIDIDVVESDIESYKDRYDELSLKDQLFVRDEIPQFLSVSLLLDTEFRPKEFYDKYKMHSFDVMESLQEIIDQENTVESLNSADLGAIIHDLFFQFNNPPKDVVLSYLNTHYKIHQESFPIIMDYAYAYWDSPFYQDIVKDSVIQDKERQVLALVDQGIMIRSTADLYVSSNDKHTIVDYKLSVSPHAKERYHRQLSYYALLSENAGYMVDSLVLFDLKKGKEYYLEWDRAKAQKFFDKAVANAILFMQERDQAQVSKSIDWSQKDSLF